MAKFSPSKITLVEIVPWQMSPPQSVQDIDLTIKSNELRLRVEGNSQTITLPAVVRDADYTAKFVKKKRLLRLAFEKLM